MNDMNNPELWRINGVPITSEKQRWSGATELVTFNGRPVVYSEERPVLSAERPFVYWVHNQNAVALEAERRQAQQQLPPPLTLCIPAVAVAPVTASNSAGNSASDSANGNSGYDLAGEQRAVEQHESQLRSRSLGALWLCRSWRCFDCLSAARIVFSPPSRRGRRGSAISFIC